MGTHVESSGYRKENTMATVWVLEVRGSVHEPARFRLLSDMLPVGAEKLTVSLSTSPGGCMTSLTALHTHDWHAGGTAEDYVSRVVNDVRKQLKTLDWAHSVPTGYRFHQINV